jgi:hypothetical protein
MAPPQVAAVLRGAGYTLRGNAMGSSWEALVSRRIASNRAGAAATSGMVVVTEWYLKGDEEVEVSYAPVRGGSAVKQVVYYINSAAIGEERFRTLVHQRYGTPTRSQRLGSTYCAAAETSCDGTNQWPLLEMTLGGLRLRLLLRQGERARVAHAAEMNAEIERGAPPLPRPTF